MSTQPDPAESGDGPALEPIHVLRPRRTDALAELFREFEEDTAAGYEVTDRADANQSIHAGARHLRDLIRRYRGDLARVAAAYNAGPDVVDEYGGVPPYAETRAYVEKVLALHARYRATAP